jgi:hypothetical protein
MKLFTWIKGLLPPNDFDLDREIDREITRRRGSNPPAPGNKPAAPAGPPTKPQPTGGRLIYGDRDPGPVPPRLPDDLAKVPVMPAEILDGAATAPAPADMPSDELMGQWKSIASHEWLHGGPPVSHRVALLAIAWARQQQAQSLQIPPPGADPVLTAEDLDGAAAAPAEMPSDELMERWKRAAIAEYLNSGEPTWRTAALLAFAEGQQQAQSLQLPPPGADPVVTDEELMNVWKHPLSFSPNDARRAIYARGRADERTAILQALGVQP